MIKTEVKKLAEHEHEVQVRLPQSEYDRIYSDQVNRLVRSAKLPGFRPGKTPMDMITKQFGAKLHEDTVSQLLQEHYVAAIESSGLTPAVQPELDIPAIQPAGEFAFTLKVVTWPKTDAKDLKKLKFDATEVTVEEADIQAVIDRLQASQVSYEIEEGRAAEKGDQLHIDFVGFIDGEAFEGGRGEDVPLVLGEGRFIPGFEDQLIGKKGGEECTVEVTFPAEYQAKHLAGKPASFEAVVKSVGKAVPAENEDALAKMLGFDDAAAMRADVQQRLQQEAADAGYQSTRDAALDALLAANEVSLPEPLIEADARETAKRVAQNLRQQGIDATNEMFNDDAFRKEVRERSERGLKLSVLLQSVRDQGGLELADGEIDEEIERMSAQYPAEQRQQFVAWLKSQQEQVAAVRERLLERKCVEYIVSQAKTKAVSKPLSVWQNEQDATA